MIIIAVGGVSDWNFINNWTKKRPSCMSLSALHALPCLPFPPLRFPPSNPSVTQPSLPQIWRLASGPCVCIPNTQPGGTRGRRRTIYRTTVESSWIGWTGGPCCYVSGLGVGQLAPSSSPSNTLSSLYVVVPRFLCVLH